MTAEQQRHARIMWECGCAIEDIFMAFGGDVGGVMNALRPLYGSHPKLQAVARSYLRVPRYPQATGEKHSGSIAA